MLYTWDGIEAHTVQPGDAVFIFRSVADIDKRVPNMLGEQNAVINREATYTMYYKNIPMTNKAYTAKFLYRVLEKPVVHPVHGYIEAWGFWNYTFKP